MFKIFKSRSILSLLLVFALTLSLLPGTAFATDAETGEHTHTDECSHEEESQEVTEENGEETAPSEEASNDITPTEESAESEESESSEEEGEDATEEEVFQPEEEVTQPAYSGTVGESAVLWSFNPASGQLTITGSGGCDTFRSADDQPWAHLRTEIYEVWFNSMDSLAIENLAYWFDGCTALHTAEIPYTTLIIGERAFANCPSLEELRVYFYDEDDFEIAPSAFTSSTRVNMRISLISEQQLATHKIVSFAWEASNREVHFFDVYSILPLPDCALGACTCTSCDWYYDYISSDASEHDNYVCCTGCSASFWVGTSAHTFSGGSCTACGYSSGGGGGYVEPETPTVCYHYYTSTSWYGCDWYEYCDSCDALVDYGTSHGTYTYGSWEYYTTSQHRRSYTCSDCGQGSYSYAYHSTTTSYSKYSSTQHTKGSYCSTCASYVGSTTKESHSFSYGSWTNYDGTQHRRTKSCSSCGYSTYEYANHSLSYGSYTSYNATQHRRKVSCSCGYSTYEYVNHTITTGSWTSASDTQHTRTKSCSVCSYSTTETGSHSITNGTWTNISSTQHQRTNTCSSCSYSKTEKASHTITSTAWASISATQHQRTNSCTTCSYSATEKASHSISSTAWKSISDTQHSRTNSCSCGYSAVEKASHSLTNGSWTNYNDTQHRRTKTCSCGYSTYEYGDHTITTTAWKNASATQHSRTHSCGTCTYTKTEMQNHSITSTAWKSVDDAKHTRTNSCSCGYSAVETVVHSFTYGAWTSKSATQHQRTKSCSCGYSTLEVASHTITNSAWTSISEENHQRTNSCSCGYSVKETVIHADGNEDDYCDSCNYLMTRFSVTVPATLSLTVSKSGEVYAASSAVIINNSTDVVRVTGITLKSANGWTIVPYTTNMANRKVDSKVIGFSINNAKSIRTGTTEALSLSSGWDITKGASLALNYDAVVSASSEPIKEQVLTIVFVVDWAE